MLGNSGDYCVDDFGDSFDIQALSWEKKIGGNVMLMKFKNKPLAILLSFALFSSYSDIPYVAPTQSAHAQGFDPRVVAGPEYLVFSAVTGSTGSLIQTFDILNGTEGTLSYTIAESCGWFGVSSSGGSVPAGGKNTVTVTGKIGDGVNL